MRQSWRLSEVFQALAIVWSSQENSVASQWVGHNELVQGDRASSRLQDPLTGTSSELESANLHLGDFEEALVVSDRSHNNDGLFSSQ